MSEKLSKLEALKWTWVIWRDVAASYVDEHGALSEHNVISKYKAAEAYGKEFKCGCPCCAYMVENHQPVDAEADWCIEDSCILNDVWGSGMAFACEEADSSPYNKRRSSYANTRIDHQAAQKIADGAWKLYVEECKAQGGTLVDKFFTPITDKA